MSSSSDFTSSTETLAETTKATVEAAENTKDYLENVVSSIRDEIEQHPTRALPHCRRSRARHRRIVDDEPTPFEL